ncbi:MAG: hypothetical protein CL772_04505 [Chloroflexi bacterium]|nr:hypothetical protein [Chloroflexota bacterium]|tara:strand:+ start:52047 stop:53009 length:963 start_codon:yes stop_codon:yes gene_type:complete
MLKTYTIPITTKQITNLYDLWVNNGFENEKNIDINKNLLSGSEVKSNQIKLYVYEKAATVLSSAIIIINNNNPSISGVGEVCTSVNSRGKGLANTLCEKIVDDYFLNNQSRAIFLGTINPVAEKIYKSLGWQMIKNTNVMFNSKNQDDFESFLLTYNKPNSTKIITKGNSDFRISIIPFVLSQRSKNQIDLNSKVNLINKLSSCLGLYNKYDSLYVKKGNWFSVSDKENRLFSIVSYLEKEDKKFRIDGLFNYLYYDEAKKLVEFVINKLVNQKPNKISVEIYKKDTSKLQMFHELGFIEKNNIQKKIDGKDLEFKEFIL